MLSPKEGWIAAVALVGATQIAAKPAQATSISSSEIGRLCNAVADGLLSTKGLEFMRAKGLAASLPEGSGMYQYEEIMFAAAGIVENDSPSVTVRKMQAFWLDNRESLHCHQVGFSLRNGNLAKLAFERANRTAIRDFIRRWKLDMNFVDPVDGKTLLDFVESEQAKAVNKEFWQAHRDLLVRFGAKRRSELQ